MGRTTLPLLVNVNICLIKGRKDITLLNLCKIQEGGQSFHLYHHKKIGNKIYVGHNKSKVIRPDPEYSNYE